MIFFSIVMLILVLGITPLLWGGVIALQQQERGLRYCYFIGTIWQWGMFEVVCLIFTLLKLRFSILVMVFCVILLLGDICALVMLKTRIKGFLSDFSLKKILRKPGILSFVLFAMIIFQALMLGIRQHEDIDDSSYITASTTMIETDTMYQYNHQTGEPVEKLDLRRALSAFPQYLSFLAKAANIHLAALARTVWPMLAIPFVYLVYSLIGERMFKNNKESLKVFLILLCLLNIYGYSTPYTNASFMLLRIWQGKAVLAAIIIPAVWYICWRAMEKSEDALGWMDLEMVILSSCMMTTMGVMIAPIIVGIFGIIFFFIKRKMAVIWKGLLCCAPCIFLSIIYIVMR